MYFLLLKSLGVRVDIKKKNKKITLFIENDVLKIRFSWVTKDIILMSFIYYTHSQLYTSDLVVFSAILSIQLNIR